MSVNEMTRPLRVVLVDDSEDLRLMLRIRLEARSAAEICGEAGDGLEAIEVVTALQPDAVVLDLAMPRMDGLQAARRIRDAHPDMLLIALTGYTEQSLGEEAREAGFDHFLTKGETLEELEQILRERAA